MSATRSIKQKLIRWVVFSVVFPLVPLEAAYGKAEVTGPPITIAQLVARGGLFILAVGLSAGAIAELLTVVGDKFASTRLGIGGLCLINLFAAALFYTVVSDAYTAALQEGKSLEEAINVATASLFSLVLYIAAVVTGGACVVIATLTEHAVMVEDKTRERVTRKNREISTQPSGTSEGAGK